MITTNPDAYLPGFDLVTTAADGSLAAATLDDSTKYVVIPLATLVGLAEADADPTTGDIREVMLALSEVLVAAYQALPSVNAPRKWIPRLSSSISSGNVTRFYSQQFIVSFTGEAVANE